MKRRFFRSADEKAYDKAHARLQSKPALIVGDWANASLWAVQEGLEHPDDPAALEQCRIGIVGVLASVDVLLDRHRTK